MVKKTKSGSKKVTKKVVKKNTKTTKNLSSKKTTTKKVETVTPPTPPVETTASTTATAATTATTTATTTTTKKSTTDDLFNATVSRIEENYDSLITEVDALVKLNKALSSRLKKSKKSAVRELSNLYKKTRNDNKKRKTRKPSGFAKPSPISDELCEFLGKPKGTEMARTAVTSFITEYIREHNLQNPKNKKEIIRDAKLKKIIVLGPDDGPLTYFNIQKYMKPHYKTSSSVAVSV